jgi:hypothetical protein
LELFTQVVVVVALVLVMELHQLAVQADLEVAVQAATQTQ